jgi:hypothetical protein
MATTPAFAARVIEPEEMIARRICRNLGSNLGLLPDLTSGVDAGAIYAGLCLALQRGWLTRQGCAYVLTAEGLELVRRLQAGQSRPRDGFGIAEGRPTPIKDPCNGG